MSLSTLHQMRHLAEQERWSEIESFFNQSQQLRQIHAVVDLSDRRKPTVKIPEVTEVHRGGIGGEAVNGGVISMLVDLAIGLLGLNFYKEGMTATSHLSIHFVRPLIAREVLLEATLDEVIGNRIFGNVRVMDEQRRVAAYASGTLAKAIKT